MKDDEWALLWVPKRVKDEMKIAATRKGLTLRQYAKLELGRETDKAEEAMRRLKNGLF